MRKALIGLTAAAALAAATVSTPASATPAWVVPALIVTAVSGVLIGAAIANNNQTVVAGHGITPSGACEVQTRISPDGTPYQVQICP